MKAASPAFVMFIALCSSQMRAADTPTTRPALNIVDRVSCSSLCQCRQPVEKALKTIGDMGFKYVDLACLPWAPHVDVPHLMKDFDAVASRVEAALKTADLKVSNLTYDPIGSKPFEEYRLIFKTLVRLAGRLHAPLINLMAPAAASDRIDDVKKLQILQQIAKEGGIILTLETHVGQVTEKPADAAWFCRQVPGLGLTLDPSHYFAGPNQGKDFSEVYRYVRNTGFRAGGMSWKTIQSPWGEGPMDFVQITRDLESRGYRGYYVVEYIEGFNNLDPVAESRKFLAWAKALK